MTDAADLIAMLAARGETVAVAESLTGGGLTELLTRPPGASAVVRGGLVVYATDTKATLAGVDPTLLEREGPVHWEVAAQLAAGAQAMFSATYGLGITGVAGPDEQGGHPVGEVHVGVAGTDGVHTRQLELMSAGDRAGIRAAAAQAAVALLVEVLGEEIS